MRNLVIGLFLFASSGLSVYASTNCTYAPSNSQQGSGGLDIIEPMMKQKGFQRVYDYRNFAYTLKYKVDWRRDSDTGTTGHVAVRLVRNSDKKILSDKSYDGPVSGFFSTTQVNSMLKKMLRNIPKCSDL